MTTMSTALQVIDPPALPMPVIDSPALEVLDRTVTRVARQMPPLLMMVNQYNTFIDQSVNSTMEHYEVNQKVLSIENKITGQIEQSNKAQKQLNQSVDDGAKKSSGFLDKVKSIAKTVKNVANFLKPGVETAIRMSDEYQNMRLRLERINDGNQTTEELQDKIFAAANRARGDYSAMASVVVKLGATDAFSGNESIAFTELMQKSFRASGASPAEQQSGMTQISEAMAKGSIGSGDFDLIMNDAPMMAKAIADYTGLSMEQLRKLSDEGKISSEILKNAVFAASGGINNSFNDLPKTFADVFTGMKDHALQSFGPVFQKLNDLVNSPGFTDLMTRINAAITLVASVAELLVGEIVNIFNLIMSNWSIIEPILLALVFVYVGKLIASLTNVIPILKSIALKWLSMSMPILLIVGVVALLMLVFSQMGLTAEQVLGFIGELFGILYATVYNIIAFIWNLFATFAEFLMNLFNHPLYAAGKLFVNFANTVLDLLKMVAEAIDAVFGTDIADGITNLQGKMEEWLGEEPEGYKVVNRMESKSLAEAAMKGYQIGADFGKGISNALDGFSLDDIDYGVDPSEYDGTLLLGEDSNINKVNEVGKIRDTVDVSSEDLKLMRELAELKNIQNFVTLTPQVSVQTGDIRETADTQTIISQITNQLTVELESSARGVYA